MVQYLFPGGKYKAVTFSFDDGRQNDIRLAQLLNRYNLKGTFHLNGKNYFNKTASELQAVKNCYRGHEIACHTVHHGFVNVQPGVSVVHEVLEDRKILEQIAGYPVVGMSYPFGVSSKEAIAAFRACGIVYSRTTQETNGRAIPNDFMQWDPSAHFLRAQKAIDNFLRFIQNQWLDVLYLWGHSFELKTEQDWSGFEKDLTRIAKNQAVWYATNIEICRYLTAAKQLQLSANESLCFNPCATDIWVEVFLEENVTSKTVLVPGGATVQLK